jgi:hypothetical protein
MASHLRQSVGLQHSGDSSWLGQRRQRELWQRKCRIRGGCALSSRHAELLTTQPATL